MDQPVPNPITQSPVDRSRRFYFVSRLVAFCMVVSLVLIVSVGLGFLAPASHLVELYIDGLLGTATATGLAYIGGSVVDYNGGVGNLFRQRERVAKINLPDSIPEDSDSSAAKG